MCGMVSRFQFNWQLQWKMFGIHGPFQKSRDFYVYRHKIVFNFKSIFIVILYFDLNDHRIIKNGGAVQFSNQRQLVKEYNSIQLGSSGTSQIKVVDATDSSIMALGFEHFKGCKAIEHIILNRCKHMENEALEQLTYVKHSLKELQVTDCPNVIESGLLSLKQLNHLQKLTIYNFIYIKDFNSIVNQLKKDLPGCEIVTNKQ